jgi:hypothetical protein
MGEPSAGTYTAVLDRFEEDLAVLILEDDGETVGQHVTSTGNLPDDACTQDAVLEITLGDGELVNAEYDAEETDRRSAAAQERFDRLSQRPPTEDTDDSESQRPD